MSFRAIAEAVASDGHRLSHEGVRRALRQPPAARAER
jgi:hypothetical protein